MLVVSAFCWFLLHIVGWLACRQAAVCVFRYYTILRTRGALPVSKKKQKKKNKKLWAGVGWRKGLYSGGHCISGKFKKNTYQ